MPSRFTQYGVAAGIDTALREMIAQRIAAEMEQRKRLVENYKLQQDDDRIRAQAAEAQALAQYRQDTLNDAVLNREAGRVRTQVEESMPSDVIDPTNAALWRKHGFGGFLRTGREAQAAIDAALPSDLAPGQAGPPAPVEMRRTSPPLDPAAEVSRGGSRYLAAREAAAERSADRAALTTAQDERAREQRALQLQIAQMQNAGAAESRGLRNQLTQMQIDAAQDKRTAAQNERTKLESSARATTQSAYDLATRLLDPGDIGANIGAATGAYELRGFTQGAQDFNGVRTQLIAALAQPNLGLLKGPMSDKDIAFVKQLATRLENSRLSEPETKRALMEAQQFLISKGAIPKRARSRRFTAVNPTTGEVLYSDDGVKWDNNQ